MKKITLILLLIVGAGMSQEKHYGSYYIKESGDIKEYHMTSKGLKVLLK
jgi:zinc protease